MPRFLALREQGLGFSARQGVPSKPAGVASAASPRTVGEPQDAAHHRFSWRRSTRLCMPSKNIGMLLSDEFCTAWLDFGPVSQSQSARWAPQWWTMAGCWEMVCVPLLFPGCPVRSKARFSDSRLLVSNAMKQNIQFVCRSFSDDVFVMVHNRSAATASCLGADLEMANMFPWGGRYLSANDRDRTSGGGELFCAAVVNAQLLWTELRWPLKILVCVWDLVCLGKANPAEDVRRANQLGAWESLAQSRPIKCSTAKVDTSSLDNPSSAIISSSLFRRHRARWRPVQPVLRPAPEPRWN